MLSAPNYQPVPKEENQRNTLLLNRFLFTLFVLLSALIPQRVWAQVKSANDATKTIINQNGNQFNITGGVLSSDQANLFHSFSQFSLSQNQIANFLAQPQVKNILARVVGANASIINGILEVTGGNSNLFLMNPAGIVFGTHAQLNVPASFTATTATGIGFGNNMSFNATGLNDYASLVGNPQNFAFQISQPGSVINAGVLQVAQGQNLLLLGGNAINTGTLTAPSGNLTIAAVPGSSLVRVSQLGHLLSLEISPQQANISNGITALTLPELLTGAGLNPAREVTVDSSGQTALVSGHLNVSGETGGTVEVVGRTVNLVNADIHASGTINGGTVLIGGDYQGQGTIPDSQVTFVDDKSEIKADAINSGNGGKVIVWSDDNTDFSGAISAKGGIQNGNGGFVETSGKNILTIGNQAKVNTFAPQGQVGTWLLDPTDLTVVASGGTGSISSGSNSTADSTINNSTIVAALNGTNVNLTASNDITVNAAIDASGNSEAGNLALSTTTANLNAPIILKAGSTLSGTATTVNVGSNGLIQNGIDAAATGGNVNLAAANYTVSQPVEISKSLTVTGAGASSTIVSGGGTTGVFDISGSGTNVTLNEIEITNGNAEHGGGIQVESGSLITLTDSNLVNNSASSFGGGIYLNGGTATISNSTLSGNSASSGGGIYSNNGTATISNSTFSGNSASSGGGIYNNFATVYVTNSIIAGDTGGDNNEVYSDGGTFTSGGYNLVGVNGNAGGFPTISTDITLKGPITSAIAPLGNYGGNTETFALVPNSPAIDAGNNADSPSTDQRGVLRGGFGGLNAGSKVDIGAFEATSSYVVSNIEPTSSYVVSNTLEGNISLVSRDATLPEQVLFPENTRFLPNSIIPNVGQSSLNEAEFIRQTLIYNFANGHTQEIIDDPNVFLIEELRQLEYTAYYGNNLAPSAKIQTAEDIRKTLKKIFEQTGKRSAVIYTLTQPDSLEIIVVFPEGKVIYKKVEVKQEVLISLTRDFRNRVVNPLKQGYKTAGQKIYNLLIAPIKADLVAQKIDTLLFSVDDGLRSIPMAALFDGHHFLVENYSLGLIPSISLMDTHYKAIKNARILAMGASKFVEQNPLPGVVVELPVVTQKLGQGRFFINQEFTIKNLKAFHHEYPTDIIHLATHGEFVSGTPSNSFIQFWNKEKLRLDQIRQLQLQDPPVELLVLSACRTALGNEDVELGFAGLAIQSGTKSALASLWSVSDEGTLALMNEFYQNLKTSPIRAEAIQQAQIAMLEGKLYVKNGELQGTKTKIPLPPELKGLNSRNLSHPYYWAAFTMIGSPW